MAQQHGLGRGLASLIPPKKKSEDGAGSSPFHTAAVPRMQPVAALPAPQAAAAPVVLAGRNGEALEIPLEKIVPNPHQPRLHFDETKLDELAQSIREHGILQPLVVSRVGDNYEIIAGERRFQAAKRLGLETVPVVVRSATEQEKLELAIIENIQRHNLNPIEEAKAYLRLLDEFAMQQEAVAKKMGKSRSAVANTLRLLHLPIEIQRAVAEGKISEGHAKALLAIENPEKQRAVFELIIKEELTVRETEVKVRSVSVKPHTRSTAALHPDILARTERLTQILGTKVKIAPSGKGGKVVIEYYAPEDLDSLLRRLEE
ncbi:MAG: ParB/RepB/Spo0J family partition protein [Patescibacteria group bacterium]